MAFAPSLLAILTDNKADISLTLLIHYNLQGLIPFVGGAYLPTVALPTTIAEQARAILFKLPVELRQVDATCLVVHHKVVCLIRPPAAAAEDLPLGSQGDAEQPIGPVIDFVGPDICTVFRLAVDLYWRTDSVVDPHVLNSLTRTASE